MPGRQAHGRPLAGQSGKPPVKKTRAKHRLQKNALNAFGIAQEQFPTKQKKTPRNRELDAEIERKHGRDDEDGEDDEDEEDEPQRKKVKSSGRSAGNDNTEYGSDSEGNEWQLGGMAEDDEDSEIESDDAFGESDEEKFADYTFRGTKSKPSRDEDSEDDENDDEGETLGEEAIDLATALDQYESSDDEPGADEDADDDDSEEDEDSEDSRDSDESDDSEPDDDLDEEADPEKLEALQGLISGYGGEEQQEGDGKATSRQKIGLGDLGLSGITDPYMSKSLKLMKKEDKEKRPGASKKLEVPLARREQGRLDRTAAYEKTNETLGRWADTVKANRRAEHLMFPLPQNSATNGLNTAEIQPLMTSKPGNELESAVMSIMEQSGLAMEKPSKPKEEQYDEDGNVLTRKEIQNRKRMERELNSREAKRAKRIKKIKSKAYHRVHRRQRERDEMATKEAMEEAGEIDSEEEREAQDRRRALERVGQRHKESKWAKLGSKAKRAVWDDDYRAGLTEMARKDEELRRRKEGRVVDSDDETSSSGSDDDDGDDDALRRKLDALDNEEEQPQKGLMGMKFMQKAEAARKQVNDDMIKDIRRGLDGTEVEASDEESEEVGRRQYGVPGSKTLEETAAKAGRPSKKGLLSGASAGQTRSRAADSAPEPTSTAAIDTTAPSTAGAWSRGESRRKKKGVSGSKVEDLDLNSNVMVAAPPPKPKSSSKKASTSSSSAAAAAAADDDDSDSDADAAADRHLPLAIRDQEMVARAFAGEDVVGEFEREKGEVADEDDDRVVDNTLPGWGSWVGDGVSAREQKRNQGRFMSKVDGVKKKKDRQDAKLDKVIINEKRIKKNDQYLASQLPHPFESRQQYERSLRLPVGPEWMTKETFQESTKPRVLMKQGVIAPMSKPTV